MIRKLRLMCRRLKVWLAWKLLGEPEEVNREVEYTWAEIWPKHEEYEAKNKLVLKEAFLRVIAGMRRGQG